MGVVVKIVYARVGAAGNPQAKIIGVARRFKTADVTLEKGVCVCV